MELLIELLERKNLCFRNFHKVCSDFLDEISKGNADGLDAFQKTRQGLLHVLETVDGELSQHLRTLEDRGALDHPSSKLRTQVNFYVRERESVVQSILDLDLQILSHIDKLKSETIQKLQSLQSGKKTISAYRSPLEQIERAEEPKSVNREV